MPAAYWARCRQSRRRILGTHPAVWTEAQYDEAADRANELLANDQDDEARAVLEEALNEARAGDDEAMTAYFEGRLARMDQDNERAEELLRRAAELKPESVFVLRSMGSVLGAVGNQVDEIAWYDRALAIRPDDPLTLLSRGSALGESGALDESLECMERAIALEPRSPAYLLGLGLALGALGRYDKAVECFDTAITVWPDFPSALKARGSALAALGRYEEAIESYDKALAVQPDDPGILSGRGRALSILRRYEEAIHYYDKSLACQSDNPDVLSARAASLASLGKLNEAIEWFDKALAIDPEHPHATWARAAVDGGLGHTEEAKRALRNYLMAHPDHEMARSWLLRFSSSEEAFTVAQELENKRHEREEERRKAETKARDRKIKLDAWRSLSARSAHRIGNQLFASQGAIRTLKQATSGEAAEAAEDLAACLDRMSTIVQEFRTFSLNRPPQLNRGHVGPVVQEVARRYRGLAEGVSVEASVPADLPACRFDRSQIDQAMSEVLENAIHHVPAGGRIDVTVHAPEAPGPACVRVTIQDNGPGVPPQMKARIFQPFQSGRPGGSGLGLAIVRQIVENHKGTIRETGEPGKGARFEIDLPAVDDSETPP